MSAVYRDTFLAHIATMSSLDESNQVRDEMPLYKDQASEQDYETVRRALSVRLNQLADQFQTQISETADVLRMNGKTYQLDNWLTVADYANKYGVNKHIITNWVRRGTILEGDVLMLSRINNTRMVRDRTYK